MMILLKSEEQRISPLAALQNKVAIKGQGVLTDFYNIERIFDQWKIGRNP